MKSAFLILRGWLLLGLFHVVHGNEFFDDGNPIVYFKTLGSLSPDYAEVGGSISTSIIIQSMRAPTDGVVHNITLKVGSIKEESSVFVQIWRAVSDNSFQLKRTRKVDMTMGVNVVELMWYITAGDYIGVSCNGYCPIFKDPASPQYRSFIRMNGYLNTVYSLDIIKQFIHPQLSSRLAVEAVLELNAPEPPTTRPEPPKDVQDTTSSDVSSNPNSAVSSTTRVQNTNPNLSQQATRDNTVLWWFLGSIIGLIVIIALVLSIVCLVCWRQETSTLKRELLASRPTSPVASTPSSTQMDTYRRAPLQSINELEVNDRHHPTISQAGLVIRPSTLPLNQ